MKRRGWIAKLPMVREFAYCAMPRELYARAPRDRKNEELLALVLRFFRAFSFATWFSWFQSVWRPFFLSYFFFSGDEIAVHMHKLGDRPESLGSSAVVQKKLSYYSCADKDMQINIYILLAFYFRRWWKLWRFFFFFLNNTVLGRPDCA